MDIQKKEPIIFIIAGKANAGEDTTSSVIKNYATLKGKSSINLTFSTYVTQYAKEITDWTKEDNKRSVAFLQSLGTEIIRNKIDNEFFIKRIMQDIEVYSYFFDIISISDARFPEELEVISKTFKNVYKIKIDRPNYNNHLSNIEQHHRTETALDNYNNYDYVVNNDGSIEDLALKIYGILDKIIK